MSATGYGTRGEGFLTPASGMNIRYESTYKGSNTSATWSRAIRDWFAENQHFAFGTGSTDYRKTVIRYTQVGKIIVVFCNPWDAQG